MGDASALYPYYDRTHSIRTIAYTHLGGPYFPPGDDEFTLFKRDTLEVREAEPLLQPSQGFILPNYGHAVMRGGLEPSEVEFTTTSFSFFHSRYP